MEVALRVDRLFSPWTLNQIEQQLVGTQAFEKISTISREGRSARVGGVPALMGRAAGTAVDSDADIRMAYAVLDLGREKLLARFVGPTEQLAYNEGVLRDSLASLEGERLLVGELDPVEMIEWSSVSAVERQNRVPVPAGWVVEPGAPTVCRGLSNSNATGSAVPVRDFSVVLRVAVWPDSVVPEDAASACSSRRGSLGRASYASRADWLGVAYSVEGVFVRVGSQMLQLEVLSPDRKSSFARALLAVWLKRATE
jgi:hypothetical protein